MDKEPGIRNVIVYLALAVVVLLIAGNIATCATSRKVGADC